MKTKWEYYQTAFYPTLNEYVKLVKYHKYAHYYDIRTIDGVNMRVFVTELTNFVL